MKTQPIPADLREALLAPRDTATPRPSAPDPRPTDRHKSGRPVPRVSGRGLTNRQKAVLCQIARTAYDQMRKHGLVDEGATFEDWRHAEQVAAVGIGSLRECRQAHYLALKAHFEVLAGKRGAQQFADLTAPMDHPDRVAAGAALLAEIERFAELPDREHRRTGWHAAEGYLLTIAAARAVRRPAGWAEIRDTWPVKRMWELVYTLRNRIAAKTGAGKPANRNKGQLGGGD